MLAHIAGIPFEEWVPTLAAGCGGTLLAVRSVFMRIRRSGKGDPSGR
jgi:hypothetical protein